MWWVAVLAAMLMTACGSAGSGISGSGSTSALVTGDGCALHQDAVSCRADSQGCNWYLNTRPCQLGQPCPAGWCNRQRPVDGSTAGGGGISGAAGCACPSVAGDACVIQVGGPAVQVSMQPAITCEAIPAGCSSSDRCTCLAQGTIERCWSSDQVTNLCICDNGIR
jgi:hypothetical protein